MGTKYYVANKVGKRAYEDNRRTHRHLYAMKAEKVGHYLIQTGRYCLGSLDVNVGLLNNCTTSHTQASQVSTEPGDQPRVGVLKGTINLLPKPDERLSFYILTA